ncbi:MAG: deoxyribodipyrimidine photo-lyase [Ilumatobacteraceae bacterium]
MTNRSIMWFRRDLRLHDHPALAEACAAGEVLPLFVVDPAFESCGATRSRMLVACIARLNEAMGGALVIRKGDPAEVVPALAATVRASSVFVTKDFAPYGRARDARVADALRVTGRRLRGVGSNYVAEPGTVLKDDGSSYSVFTPFSRRWAAEANSALTAPPSASDWVEAPSDPLPVVEASTVLPAHERWHEFRSAGLADYATQRDLPAVDGTSRLSAATKFGVIHPRELLADLDESIASHRVFRSELAWRDFYADVLHRFPKSAWENLDQRFDQLHVDTDEAAHARFETWRHGTTGFPIVDAGMRQLVETGWMHNRVRMITASFLVKDLHLPWQWGARLFMQHLIDGDLASNNHGWQWAAGSGTDAAPFFRVFNPTTQQERWDPDGEYVNRWIPELSTTSYPAPMVDHKVERLEALARYEAIKRS